MKIQDLLRLAINKKASDLHLSTGVSPSIRIDGDLISIKDLVPLEEGILFTMLKEIIPENKKSEFQENQENQENQWKQDLDFAISDVEGFRFRVSVFRQLRGISAAFRIIPQKIPNFLELGFSPIFYEICKLPYGLVLVTGPTGSGKTTTIASMIDYINQTRASHILTIEDPIEYVYQSKKSLVQQREVKNHIVSFSEALRSALREDPDFILVGEMRDLETVRLALTAAETGHLVFATLHTNSAAQSVDRIIDIFPTFEKEMIRSILAGSLQAVVSQELIVVKGTPEITLNQEIKTYQPNQHVFIPTKNAHRVTNNTQDPVVFVEVQYGDYLGENDIVRLEDIYGRG